MNRKSKCCNAEVKVVASNPNVTITTCWHECLKCGQDCDIAISEAEEMYFLGIDSSMSNTGCALITNENRLVEYWNFKGIMKTEENFVTRINPIMDGVKTILAKWSDKIFMIGMEDINISGMRNNLRNIRLLSRLQGIIEGICYRYNFEINYIGNTEMKKYLSLPKCKREEGKKLVMEAVKEKYNIKDKIDDNVSDAIAVANVLMEDYGKE